MNTRSGGREMIEQALYTLDSMAEDADEDGNTDRARLLRTLKKMLSDEHDMLADRVELMRVELERQRSERARFLAWWEATRLLGKTQPFEKTMPVQEWELTQYESAAIEVCFRLGDNPYEEFPSSDGVLRQRWMLVSENMHQTRVMVEVMRQLGILL